MSGISVEDLMGQQKLRPVNLARAIGMQKMLTRESDLGSIKKLHLYGGVKMDLPIFTELQLGAITMNLYSIKGRVPQWKYNDKYGTKEGYTDLWTITLYQNLTNGIVPGDEVAFIWEKEMHFTVAKDFEVLVDYQEWDIRTLRVKEFKTLYHTKLDALEFDKQMGYWVPLKH